MKTEHVFFRVLDGALFCSHCGAEYMMALPCPITLLVAAGKAFQKLHKGCNKP